MQSLRIAFILQALPPNQSLTRVIATGGHLHDDGTMMTGGNVLNVSRGWPWLSRESQHLQSTRLGDGLKRTLRVALNKHRPVLTLQKFCEASVSYLASSKARAKTYKAPKFA